jgi:hypothetical protein
MKLTWKHRLHLLLRALTPNSNLPPPSTLEPFRLHNPPFPILPLPHGIPPPPGLTGTKIIVRIIGRRSLNGILGSEEHTLNLTIPIPAEYIAPALCLATKTALEHTDLDPTLITSTELTIHQS